MPSGSRLQVELSTELKIATSQAQPETATGTLLRLSQTQAQWQATGKAGAVARPHSAVPGRWQWFCRFTMQCTGTVSGTGTAVRGTVAVAQCGNLNGSLLVPANLNAS